MNLPLPEVSFFVAGDPKPQPRQRSYVIRGKGGTAKLDDRGRPIVRAYDPSTAEGWKAAVAVEAEQHRLAAPLKGPLRVDLAFYFRRPRKHYRSGRHAQELRPDAPRYHSARPDRDNLEKAVLDVLSTMRFIDDDCQVCCGQVIKQYGEPAGVRVTIAQVLG